MNYNNNKTLSTVIDCGKFESLFWKVYHNKYIRNNIFRLLKLGEYKDYRNYNVNTRKKFKELTDLGWMLEKKLYKLIHYKLKHFDHTDKINVTQHSMGTLFSLLSTQYKNNTNKIQHNYNNINNNISKNNNSKNKRQFDDIQDSQNEFIQQKRYKQEQQEQKQQQPLIDNSNSNNNNNNNNPISNSTATTLLLNRDPHCSNDKELIMEITEFIMNSVRDEFKYLRLALVHQLYEIVEFILVNKKHKQTTTPNSIINNNSNNNNRSNGGISGIGDNSGSGKIQLQSNFNEAETIEPKFNLLLTTTANENSIDLIWFLKIKSLKCQILLLENGFTFKYIPKLDATIKKIMPSNKESLIEKIKEIYIGVSLVLNKSEYAEQELYWNYFDKFNEFIYHFGGNPSEEIIRKVYVNALSYSITKQNLKFFKILYQHLNPTSAPTIPTTSLSNSYIKSILINTFKSFEITPKDDDYITFGKQANSDPSNFIELAKIYISIGIKIYWMEHMILKFMADNVKDCSSYQRLHKSLELGKFLKDVYPLEYDEILLPIFKYYLFQFHNTEGDPYVINIGNSNSVKWLFKYSNYKLFSIYNRINTVLIFTFENIQLFYEFRDYSKSYYQVHPISTLHPQKYSIVVNSRSSKPYMMKKINYLSHIFYKSSKSDSVVTCNDRQMELIFQSLIYPRLNVKNNNYIYSTYNNYYSNNTIMLASTFPISNNFNDISKQSNESIIQILNFINHYDLYREYFNQQCFNQFIKEIINNPNVNGNELVSSFNCASNFYGSLMDLILESTLGSDKLDTTTLAIILNKYDPINHCPQQFIDKYKIFFNLNQKSFRIFEKKLYSLDIPTADRFPYELHIPKEFLRTKSEILINQEITNLSKEQLTKCIEILVHYLIGCVGIKGTQTHIDLVNKCFSLIENTINYLFKKLISIKFISSELVTKVYHLITGVGIKINHSLYHSIHYLIIRSSRFQKLFQSLPFGYSIFTKKFNNNLRKFTPEEYGEQTLQNGDKFQYYGYEISKLIIAEEYTPEYIFDYNTSFSDIIYPLIVKLLALKRTDIIDYHDRLFTLKNKVNKTGAIQKSYHYQSLNSMLEYSLDICDESLFIKLLKLILEAIENQTISNQLVSDYIFNYQQDHDYDNDDDYSDGDSDSDSDGDGDGDGDGDSDSDSDNGGNGYYHETVCIDQITKNQFFISSVVVAKLFARKQFFQDDSIFDYFLEFYSHDSIRKDLISSNNRNALSRYLLEFKNK